jgi:hypothetical protein
MEVLKKSIHSDLNLVDDTKEIKDIRDIKSIKDIKDIKDIKNNKNNSRTSTHNIVEFSIDNREVLQTKSDESNSKFLTSIESNNRNFNFKANYSNYNKIQSNLFPIPSKANRKDLSIPERTNYHKLVDKSRYKSLNVERRGQYCKQRQA